MARKLCQFWSSKGKCFYGNDCKYAHDSPTGGSGGGGGMFDTSSSGDVRVSGFGGQPPSQSQAQLQSQQRVALKPTTMAFVPKNGSVSSSVPPGFAAPNTAKPNAAAAPAFVPAAAAAGAAAASSSSSANANPPVSGWARGPVPEFVPKHQSKSTVSGSASSTSVGVSGTTNLTSSRLRVTGGTYTSTAAAAITSSASAIAAAAASASEFIPSMAGANATHHHSQPISYASAVGTAAPGGTAHASSAADYDDGTGGGEGDDATDYDDSYLPASHTTSHSNHSADSTAFDAKAGSGAAAGFYAGDGSDANARLDSPTAAGAGAASFAPPPLRREMDSFFMNETHRAELARKMYLSSIRLLPEDGRFHEVPSAIHNDDYHSLYPIPDDMNPSGDKNFPAATYKATRLGDGLPYAVRRIIGCRLAEEYARASLKPWFALHGTGRNGRDAAHPNIVPIRDVFSTPDFGDGGSLCFASDYYPGAITLQTRYFSSKAGARESEDVLWTYIIQLVSALCTIHSAKLACRSGGLEPNRILLTDRNRIRINLCGLTDAISMRPIQKPLPELQFEDLFSVGKLILSIACQSADALKSVSQSVLYLSTYYSPEITKLVTFLLTKPNKANLPNIYTVTGMISHRLVTELHHTYSHIDYQENELCKELQNGRFARLLMKIGFITERPDESSNERWSETGDRYLIKLFRDFVFHQQHSDGTPNVDFGHVAQALTKLDAGSQEKTLLMSRNEDSMLVVRYADLKRCIAEAFEELKGTPPPAAAASSVGGFRAGGGFGGGNNNGLFTRPTHSLYTPATAAYFPPASPATPITVAPKVSKRIPIVPLTRQSSAGSTAATTGAASAAVKASPAKGGATNSAAAATSTPVKANASSFVTPVKSTPTKK